MREIWLHFSEAGGRQTLKSKWVRLPQNVERNIGKNTIHFLFFWNINFMGSCEVLVYITVW